MVDPVLVQMVVKKLYAWYRRHAQPRGIPDHFYRGTRMNYNRACRNMMCLLSLFALSLSGALYFVPSIFENKPHWLVLAIKIGWVAITALLFINPLKALLEFVIVYDDGLMRSDFIGRTTKLGWKEISGFRIKPGENVLILKNNSGTKLTMSLAYNGWQDFEEAAAKNLPHQLYWKMHCALVNVKSQDFIPSRSRKRKQPDKL